MTVNSHRIHLINIIIMQKSTFTSFLAIFAMSLFFSLSFAYAGIGSSGININLRHIPSGASQNPGAPRSLIIEAYYDSELSYVSASLSSAGTFVDVYIENQDTEEQYNYQIPGTGNSVLPISGTSGYWTITFILSNGDEYVGYFIL